MLERCSCVSLFRIVFFVQTVVGPTGTSGVPAVLHAVGVFKIGNVTATIPRLLHLVFHVVATTLMQRAVQQFSVLLKVRCEKQIIELDFRIIKKYFCMIIVILRMIRDIEYRD